MDTLEKFVTKPSPVQAMQSVLITTLERENAELKERIKCLEHNCNVKQEFNDRQFDAVVMKYREEAKDLIRNIIRVTWGEGWGYSLDWKVKAEKFLEA